MKTFFSSLAITICLAALSLPAQSRELPEYYPDQVRRWVTIDQIDLRRLKIIVDDLPMDLSQNAKVHSLTTEFSSLQALKPGMKIIFSSSGGKIINEIWILPKNFRHHVIER